MLCLTHDQYHGKRIDPRRESGGEVIWLDLAALAVGAVVVYAAHRINKAEHAALDAADAAAANAQHEPWPTDGEIITRAVHTALAAAYTGRFDQEDER